LDCKLAPPQVTLIPEAQSAGVSTDQRLMCDLREANGQLVRAALNAQELTEKAQVAQALAEAAMARLRMVESELRATAEFREQLLGIVGHDLRNPLGAISMSAQFLMSRSNLGEEESRLLALVLRSTHRMDRMISQLFEFTRARLGSSMPLQRTRLNLEQLCRQAIDELALSATVEMRYDWQGDLAGNWDGARMVEALSNLIGNALEHATPKSWVVITGVGTPTEVVMTVQNHGAEISQELLPVLFEPFRSGRQGPAAKPGHLGLGLYIAHEIASSHGGTLQAKSAAGMTTFTLRIPRDATAESPDPSPSHG